MYIPNQMYSEINNLIDSSMMAMAYFSSMTFKEPYLA